MPDASCCSSCNTGPRPRTDVSAISAAAWQLCPVPGRQWDACTQAAAPPCCVGTLEAQRSSAHCSHLHDRLQRSGDLLLQLRASFLGAGRADGRASHTRGEGASETQQLLCGQRCCGVWAPGVSRQGAAGTASAGPPQRSVQAGVCIVTGSGHRCRSPPARVISGGGRGEGAAPVPASWPPAPPGAARMPTSCSARCASCWVGSSPAASVTTEAAGLAGPASGGGGKGRGQVTEGGQDQLRREVGCWWHAVEPLAQPQGLAGCERHPLPKLALWSGGTRRKMQAGAGGGTCVPAGSRQAGAQALGGGLRQRDGQPVHRHLRTTQPPQGH